MEMLESLETREIREAWEVREMREIQEIREIREIRKIREIRGILGSSGDSGGGGSGGLGSTARNTGSATLHYWAPGGDGSKNGYHGHVSLTLDDGTYISYWPDVGRYGHPKGGIYVFYWMPARTADYDKDLEGEVIGHH